MISKYLSVFYICLCFKWQILHAIKQQILFWCSQNSARNSFAQCFIHSSIHAVIVWLLSVFALHSLTCGRVSLSLLCSQPMGPNNVLLEKDPDGPQPRFACFLLCATALLFTQQLPDSSPDKSPHTVSGRHWMEELEESLLKLSMTEKEAAAPSLAPSEAPTAQRRAHRSISSGIISKYYTLSLVVWDHSVRHY